jgi:sterol desaturase/sphingolipid hydroxylase (fatty acid hydroxylase superfamily)
MLAEFAQTWLASLAVVVFSAIGCAAIEYFAALEKQSFQNRVRALLFWSVFLAATAAIVVPVQALVRLVGIEPLFSLDLTTALTNQQWPLLVLGYALLPFAPYFLFDCLYYWFHRLQHALPFLWRFHAVHHSIEELNAANCYHHVSEGLFRLPFVVLPLMLVINLKVPDVVILTAVLSAWGQFVHSNTWVSFGSFDRLLASPRFHRVHHSLAPEHTDKNFASFFPIFDVLFGTAYFPRPAESIKTGLCNKREAKTLKQYIVALADRSDPRSLPIASSRNIPRSSANGQQAASEGAQPYH